MHFYELVNWVAIGFFAVVWALSLSNLIYVNSTEHPQFDRRRINRSLLSLILVMLIIASVLFIGLRSSAIINNHHSERELNDIMWLVLEYLAGVALVLINMLISSLTKWTRREWKFDGLK